MADKNVNITERMYQVVVRPIITEKSSQLAENNCVTFEVAKDATKLEIRKAVEALFSVKVEKVNTLNQQGKVKRFRGKMGVRSDVKKAMVYLAEGQSIDMSTAL